MTKKATSPPSKPQRIKERQISITHTTAQEALAFANRLIKRGAILKRIYARKGGGYHVILEADLTNSDSAEVWKSMRKQGLLGFGQVVNLKPKGA